MKKALYIIVPLIIALALRLYPTFISGMPFSTDAWPLIRNTELLMQNTPVPLDSKLFDGYNNFWPASSIFSAALSQVTALSPLNTMAIGIPIAAALTLPIFFVAKKITENSKISIIATVLLAASFPYTLLTGRSYKESVCKPHLHLTYPVVPSQAQLENHRLILRGFIGACSVSPFNIVPNLGNNQQHINRHVHCQKRRKTQHRQISRLIDCNLICCGVAIFWALCLSSLKVDNNFERFTYSSCLSNRRYCRRHLPNPHFAR